MDTPRPLRNLYGHRGWRRAREAWLRMHPRCMAVQHEPGCRVWVGYDGVIDHIVPRSQGGSTWDRSNWQTLSKLCHDAKTRRENGWGDAKKNRKGGWPLRPSALSPQRVIRIVGRPGSGKSHLRRLLGANIAIPTFDISDQPGHLVNGRAAWEALARRVARKPAVIVETAGTSRHEDWDGWLVCTVLVTAPPNVRRERLSARPEARREPGYVSRMLAFTEPSRYDEVWDGDEATVADLARRLGAWIAAPVVPSSVVTGDYSQVGDAR